MDLIAGLEFTDDLPEGAQPLSAVVCIKALDETGKVTYFIRATDDVTTVEALGMAQWMRLSMESDLLDGDDG